MSNYWPPKVHGLAGQPAPAYNPAGPWAGMAHLLSPMADGAGLTATNLLSAAVPSAEDPWEIAGNGTLGALAAWVLTGDQAPFIQCALDKVTLWQPAAAVTLNCWTMALIFRDDSPNDMASNIFLTDGINPATTQYGLSLLRTLETSALVLRWRPAGTTYNITFTSGTWNRNDWNVVVMRGSPAAMSIALNSLANEQHAAQSGAWRVPAAANCLMLSSNALGLSTNCYASYAMWALWCGWMHDREVEQVLYDPHLPFRNGPLETTQFAQFAGAPTTRPKTTSVHVSMNAAPGVGGNLESADLQARAVLGADPYNLDPATATIVTSSGIAQTDLNKDVGQDVTGLTADTEYALRREFSADAGSTWIPTGGGTQFVRTLPATAPSLFAFVVTSDGHFGSLVPPAQGAYPWGTATDPLYPQWFRYWMAAWDAYTRTYTASRPKPLFRIDLGDDEYFDRSGTTGSEMADLDAKHLANGRAVQAASTLWHRLCSLFKARGNHEFAGYQQNANMTQQRAAQKQAACAWNALVANPTSATYPEGGSDAGDPGVQGATAVARDYLPGDVEPFHSYAGGYVQYLDDFVRPATATRDLGINWTPSKDAYAWSVGGLALFIVIDPHRSAAPGDPASAIGAGGAHERDDMPWTLSRAQEEWLYNTLRRSTCKWKFVFSHSAPGASLANPSDGKYYNRWNALWAGLTNDVGRRFRRAVRRFGVTAVVFGHDHVYARCRRDGVTYITMPSTSVTLMDTTEGMDTMYGSSADEGAAIAGLPGNYPRAHGLRRMLRTCGYLYVAVSPTAVVITVRQTSHPVAAGRIVFTQAPWLGPEYAVDPATGTLTIPDAISDGNVPLSCPLVVNKSAYDAASTSWPALAQPAVDFSARCEVGVSGWVADTAYALGDTCVPTTPAGYVYTCTVTGTSHATTEPTWPTTIGDTVVDESVTWTCAKTYETDNPLASAIYPHGFDQFEQVRAAGTLQISKGSEAIVRAAVWPRTVDTLTITHNPRPPRGRRNA